MKHGQLAFWKLLRVLALFGVDMVGWRSFVPVLLVIQAAFACSGVRWNPFVLGFLRFPLLLFPPEAVFSSIDWPTQKGQVIDTQLESALVPGTARGQQAHQ